ncbi:hypothetical protein V8G54_010787 [Vigna mungo]|uniref:Uncharacterized protein n=1 Tax=Vigna mungo TaxID=3915 RepID=A0AAQ3NX77_VIGMU
MERTSRQEWIVNVTFDLLIFSRCSSKSVDRRLSESLKEIGRLVDVNGDNFRLSHTTNRQGLFINPTPSLFFLSEDLGSNILISLGCCTISCFFEIILFSQMIRPFSFFISPRPYQYLAVSS